LSLREDKCAGKNQKTIIPILSFAKEMPKTLKFINKKQIEGYLFVLPWIVGFLSFTIGPLIAVFIISLFETGLSTQLRSIGFENYSRLFVDSLFWKSMKVTAIYMGLRLPLRIMLGLLVAILLSKKLRGVGLFRTLYYLPTILTGVVVSLVWVWLLSPEFGLINYILSSLGLPTQNWLNSTTWALPTLSFMSLWQLGSAMLLYLVGLQMIPVSLYDAADIDGAGSLQKFRNITWPMLSRITLFNVIMGVIFSFQDFEKAYIMTRGGPSNTTLVALLYLYRITFQYFDFEYACAFSGILFIIIFGSTLFLFKSSSMWVFYEAEVKEKAKG